MSTSIILLDQNSNANDVDKKYLNLVSCFPLRRLGENYDAWSDQINLYDIHQNLVIEMIFLHYR